jgi:hypothetical protein
MIFKLFVVSFQLFDLVDLSNVLELSKDFKLFFCQIDISIKIFLLEVIVHQVIGDFVEIKSFEVFRHVNAFLSQSISLGLAFIFCFVVYF